jgi:ABC-type multidrug transport system ATPase subunit
MQSPFSNEFSNSPSEVGGMHIQLTSAGKRFNRDWIFRRLNYTFQQGVSYAVTGPNGSGKSTLLQTIAGAIAPSEGAVEYLNKTQDLRDKAQETISKEQESKKTEQETRFKEQDLRNKEKPETGNRKPETSRSPLTTENIYNHIAIVAPYLEVIEEMTAAEFLHFHNSFKPILSTISINQVLEIVGLKMAADKQIRYFSSGMKQRIKLAQAIFSDVPVLLLDEPCTNLDSHGYDLYHQLINDYCKNKLIIVSSNDVNEYDFCAEKLSILDYK